MLALADSRFRDRNAEYLETRFAGMSAYNLLTRVYVVDGKVITPDWNLAESRLFEWTDGLG